MYTFEQAVRVHSHGFYGLGVGTAWVSGVLNDLQEATRVLTLARWRHGLNLRAARRQWRTQKKRRRQRLPGEPRPMPRRGSKRWLRKMRNMKDRR